VPIITKPQEAIQELVQFRTVQGKVFDLGSGKRRLISRLGRVHYRRDDNQLDDIETDTEVEEGTGEIVANKLPYRFRLRSTGIGFDYQSREDGGIVRKALTRVGGTTINQNATYEFNRNGNRIRYVNVVPGFDVIFDITRSGVRTFWVPKNANAPKSVRWAMEYDGEGLGLSRISGDIHGRDNLLGEEREGRNRRPLNVSLSDGNTTLQASGRYRFFRDESWTGETQYIDPETRVRSWVNEAIYPVAIDPDITEDIVNTADDGCSIAFGSAWYSADIFFTGSQELYPGFRFRTVNVPNAATIDLAVLKFRVESTAGGGRAGTIHGVASDSAPTWSDSFLPNSVTKTTASTAVSASTATGIRSYTVTSIVQELVDRVGWSSGNNMSFTLTGGTGSGILYIEDFSDAGTDEAQLEIDYTEGGGGGSVGTGLTRSIALNRLRLVG
jgi:hypothetical protein